MAKLVLLSTPIAASSMMIFRLNSADGMLLAQTLAMLDNGKPSADFRLVPADCLSSCDQASCSTLPVLDNTPRPLRRMTDFLPMAYCALFLL